MVLRKNPALILGILLILFGLVFFTANLLDIDTGRLFWPVLLMAVGAWLIFRPAMLAPDAGATFRLLGDLERYGQWQVRDEELTVLIGDVDFDFSAAELPPGETQLRFLSFVGDFDFTLPQDIGIALQSNAFVSAAKLFGDKQDHFLNPLLYRSPNYEAAERKLRLDFNCFVADITLKQL